MDIDKEIVGRIKNTEDHFTERKESGQQEYRIREAMVAFANSVIAEKPGIIYIGVKDNGDVRGVENPDKIQKDVSSWADSCFPPLTVIPRVMTVDGKEIVAVVVPASHNRPHFAKTAYKRVGPTNVKVTQTDVDEWIAQRNSKVRLILDQRERLVSVRIIQPPGTDVRIFKDMITKGEYWVNNCNAHFVTLISEGGDTLYSEPLSGIDFKWNHATDRLVLLIKPYA